LIKIIFCAFNEEQNLPKFLSNLTLELNILNRQFEIIACLDGSEDSSSQILSNLEKSYPIKTLEIKNQRGLGLAYKRLFLHVIENSNDDDLIISLDADNTHNPKQIGEMISHFEKNSLDFLVTARFCGNSVMKDFPLHRQFISKSISILLQILFSVKNISGSKLKDYTSGYRIYKSEKLKKLFAIHKDKFITEPDFTYTCELLINLSKLDTRFDEIAISYDYGKKIGKSKLRIFSNLKRLVILLFKQIAIKKLPKYFF
jgi:dolichol-phosphate mannosyltransferase